MAQSLEEEFAEWLKASFAVRIEKNSLHYEYLRWAFYAGYMVAYSSDADFEVDLKAMHRELKAKAKAKGMVQ